MNEKSRDAKDFFLMQNLLMLLIMLTFVTDSYFLRKAGALERYVRLAPEVISMLIFMILCFHIAVKKEVSIQFKYILIFGIIVVHFFVGLLINSVPAGAILGGIRKYFKYVPLFFVPAAYNFSEKDVKYFIKFILILSLLQIPITIFQRFVLYANLATGDGVRGTLTDSGILTVVLISIMVFTWSFFQRREISFRTCCILLVLLFIPMAINETKGTVFLLPLALIIPVFLNKKNSGKVRNLIVVIVMGGMLMSIFTLAYNQLYARDSGGLVGLFVEGKIKHSLYRDADVREKKEIARIDSLLWAWNELSDNIYELSFGLGIGNVGHMDTRMFTGEYAVRYSDYGVGVTTISNLFWETGIIGIFLSVAFCLLVLKDALYNRFRYDMVGSVGLGMSGVLIIFIVSMLYKNLLSPDVIGVLFFFFCGLVSSYRARCGMKSV